MKISLLYLLVGVFISLNVHLSAASACGEISPSITLRWLESGTNVPIPDLEVHPCSDLCRVQNREAQIRNRQTKDAHTVFVSDLSLSNSEGYTVIKINLPASAQIGSDGKPEPFRAYADTTIYFRQKSGDWRSLELSQIDGVKIIGKNSKEISRCTGTVHVDFKK